MRLHLLEVTAFGPFADTVTVDFDHLSDAGLFLLSGATGAGKTSVLDAVCFALYGDVPGDRNAARRLRSDQAAPGVRPRVTLETTLSGRRFRLVRSPAWERPKKRGSGFTTEQASVTLSERVDGEWQPLSSRLDETGHLVTRLVGMNVTQFTQVAMLPQGRFQAFLRARSDERHKLLQQLFRTGRFEQVEGWLRDRRIALRRTSDMSRQGIADLVSRLSETADVPVPEDWEVADLQPWATALVADALERRDRAAAAVLVAAGHEQETRTHLEQARAVVDRRRRLEAAAAERDRIDAMADQHATAVASLDAARRAAGVVPLHRLATTATSAHLRAEALAHATTERAGDVLGLLVVDADTLAAAAGDALDKAAAVRAALPREARMREVDERAVGAEREQAEVATRLTALSRERAALPERLVAARASAQEATAAAAGAPAVEARVADLHGRLRAHRDLLSVETQLDAARQALADASAAAVELRERWLDLREARLDGMAAEIAGALAVGACCPVCGSADHPHKATSHPDAPDAAAEKAALKALDDAKATEHLHDERVRDLGTRLAVLRQQAGPDPAAVLQARADDEASGLERLRACAGEATARLDAVATLEADDVRLGAEIREAELRAESLATSLTALRAESGSLRAEVDHLLAGTGASSLTRLLDDLADRADTAHRAADAIVGLAIAADARHDADRALAEAARESGFESTEAAVAARLDVQEIAALDRRVTEHERKLAAVTALLAEPGAAELLASETVDLVALQHTHAEALAALGDGRTLESRWAGRHQRLTALARELEAALVAWAPLRHELDVTTRLSAFVEGKSPDNRLQMRLSAYVLAFRLSQVVAAANERLARMSDQRYSLEHTGRRGAGETRGGLSLLVRDDWSGESRDPATLSGGETFVVSLALALGLADVITQEAGGADLDTLFVDEGFGSLDADTLDDVMDTLDSLRDGGRVVGVVSHVAEMRDRIPTQLRVTKSRRGSTLALSR
ncbi:exonuclease SbcC [Nocardioides ginsengisegetis]|uniref:Nuclease SbcCD subunit C n=1 Tax=Nocardioides ginsengisegetis TaxID=661491 RepID=A0A7W3IZ92_9ACTN|nr:SMC family ATPase [Nocardioides ginsengisegetis]MBA8803345.1 exonuclease SbcC [Nocardioides ginsengisegetis]